MLHNLCIEENIPLLNETDDVDDIGNIDLGLYHFNQNEDIQNRQNPELLAGRRFRQNIVNRLFTE